LQFPRKHIRVMPDWWVRGDQIGRIFVPWVFFNNTSSPTILTSFFHGNFFHQTWQKMGRASFFSQTHPVTLLVTGPSFVTAVMTRVARWDIFKPKSQILVNFWGSWNGICWYIFVYFTAVRYILWTFGIFYRNLVYFSRFDMLYQEKSGNTGDDKIREQQKDERGVRQNFKKSKRNAIRFQKCDLKNNWNALAAWTIGIVSACHRGDWSNGSWDWIPPG
jgi:hypothetical protein